MDAASLLACLQYFASRRTSLLAWMHVDGEQLTNGLTLLQTYRRDGDGNEQSYKEKASPANHTISVIALGRYETPKVTLYSCGPSDQ